MAPNKEDLIGRVVLAGGFGGSAASTRGGLGGDGFDAEEGDAVLSGQNGVRGGSGRLALILVVIVAALG